MAPALVFFGLRRSSLSLEVTAGAFLTALTCALLRADVVFFEQHGLPTANALFNAKFSSAPYDFHYYTLGNPNHTAAFLLMPLSLALFWAMSTSLRRWSRALLLVAAAVCSLTLVLAYTRFMLFVGVAILAAAVLVARWSWHRRLVVLTTLFAVVGIAAASKAGSYLRDLFSTGNSSSGSIRLHSLTAGVRVIIHHPLTGVGVGRYGLRPPVTPAHSSVVEAGAEMGIFGLIGLVLLVVAFCLLFRATLRREGPRGFAAGAAIAGLAYQVPLLLTGNVGFGLAENYVAIYGLTLALVAVVALRGGTAPVAVPSLLPGSAAAIGRRVADATRPIYGFAHASYLALSKSIGSRWLLVAYGIAVSAVATARIASHIPATTLLASHQREVRDALAAIHSGAPPLLGMTSAGYYPVDGAGHGISLYLPLIGQLFHQSNPNVLMAWFFLGAFALSLAIYPLVFAELFGSRLVALVAPLLLAWRLAFIHYSDTYWVYAWSVATALPLLLLVKRRWGGPRATVLLVGTMVFASFSNSLRAYSGLPILLSGLVVLMLVGGSVRRRLLLLAACLLAYLAVMPGAFSLIGVIRDHEIHSSATYRGKVIAAPGGNGDAFWQAAYTGLAFRANRYGIDRFDSTAAIAYVRTVKPSARYRSSEYNAALRARFISLLQSDPAFVVGTEAEKGLLVADDGLKFNWTLIVMLPLLLCGRWRRAVRKDLMIVAPAVAVLFGGAVLSWPAHARLAGNEFGWLGAMDFVWVLTLLWTAAAALDASARRGFGLSRRSRLSGTSVIANVRWLVLECRVWISLKPRRLLLLAAGIDAGFAVLIAIAITSGPAQRERFYEAGASYRSSIPIPSLPVLDSWSFSGGVPGAFAPAAGARLDRTREGVEITTSSGPNARGLTSQPLDLAPGRYEVVVRGLIAHGGLALEVVTAVGARPIGHARYWTRQTRAGPATMVLRFGVRSPAPVQLVLANWSAGRQPSRWLITHVGLRWMPTHDVRGWTFTAGLPAGWEAVAGTRVEHGANGVTVTTSKHCCTYQLVGPYIGLNRGQYELVANGLVSSGGIEAGLLNIPADAWIRWATVSPSHGPSAIPGVRFSLSSPTVVQLVFANFTNPAHVSSWLIQRADIRTLTAPRPSGGPH